MGRFGIKSGLVIAAALMIAVFSAQQTSAQVDAKFRLPGTQYNPQITTPEAFIGYKLGEKPVRHDIMVGYLRSVARQSPRVVAETIGFSHEGRPILSLVISSPDNIKNLDEIKSRHKARLEGDGRQPAGERDPAVVWLNYGVHGAESAGMDAAIPTLYHYAAAQGETVETLLEETIIVMIAIFNPDGHSRRINHRFTFDSVASVTDPNHEAHNLWIEARTNHYWFDLNRDWLLLTQPESQSWIKVWHDWKPNVSADFHEMGSNSSYYFHPGEPRRKNPLIPDRARELLSDIAKGHASWLDEEGALYTSEEGFDNFYIGKGSTYPGVNGSVGILFEAAAAAGGAIETVNGIRTYANNIHLHFRSSLSTVEGAQRSRLALLDYQQEFFVLARRAAQGDDKRAYIISAPGDLSRVARFASLLNGHNIEAFVLAQDLTLGEQFFKAGQSIIVPMNQSQYTMIRGLFDRVTEFEESVFYDVSGWTLPLAYDLDFATLDRLRFNANLLGEPADAAMNASKAVPEQASYGYVFSWTPYYAPRALNRFLQAGARPRVFLNPKTLTIDGAPVTFQRGTIFVPISTAKADAQSLHEVAKTIAREDKISVFPIASGDAVPGTGDLGATGSVTTLSDPQILLLFDDGGSRYSAGQLWHLLDRNMEIAVSLRRKSEAGNLNLANYTHILIPATGNGIDKDLQKKLDRWVQQGGVLIATKAAAKWAEKALLSYGDDGGKKPSEPGQNSTDTNERAAYADKTINDAEHLIGGALFESDIDITHPLGFAVTDRSIATMRASTHVLKTPNDLYGTVAAYTNSPLLSGYASQKRIDEIAGTPMLAAYRRGAGSIILFADDPSFRATFPIGDRLVLNAIFFGKSFSAERRP